LIMTDQPAKLTPVVRLKGDKIILKLGDASCELDVTDGHSDDAAQLARVIQTRIQEVLAKRRRDPDRQAKWAEDWHMHAEARNKRFEQDLQQTMQQVFKPNKSG